MSEKLALKKALFEELKDTNCQISIEEHAIEFEDYDSRQYVIIETKINYLKHHKDFIQRLIDICVGRNKF